MNKRIITGVVCVFILLCSPVFAAGDFYVTPQAGVVFLNDSDIPIDGESIGISMGFDTGYGLGISAGYDFGIMRIEGEVGYRSNDFDTVSEQGSEYSYPGDATALSLLFNCFVDFETGTGFTPYAGVGIGVAKVEFEFAEGSGRFTDDDTVFAYQFVGGIGYPVAENIVLDISYRYFATADPSFNPPHSDVTGAEYGSHNIYMGVRFCF